MERCRSTPSPPDPENPTMRARSPSAAIPSVLLPSLPPASLSAFRAALRAGPLTTFLLLVGLATPGCQGPSVEEAGATDPGSHAVHEAHLAPREAGLAPPDKGTMAETREPSVDEAADLARVRAGTALYQQFDRAVASGFVESSGTNECVAHPEYGGMGIHLVNFERYARSEVDPSRPEILLYEPQEDGSMKLVGVEFAVNAEAWHAAGNEGLPSVAGVDYDPPNPAAENPLLQSSYTLHVWTWQGNPHGRFFPFNPRVRCPVEQGS